MRKLKIRMQWAWYDFRLRIWLTLYILGDAIKALRFKRVFDKATLVDTPNRLWEVWTIDMNALWCCTGWAYGSHAGCGCQGITNREYYTYML